ncbi:response regulator [Klebsiella pneumoniae]|uniref:response regulator n=1 Tax=Klebsiella pneumoniae TaxID=573 RepID=UPI003969126B
MPEVTIDTWSFYSRPFYWFAGLATLLILSGLLWGAYWLRSERKRKAVQAALEHQLSFHQTLFNAMPIPVYVITLKGELDSYNNAFSAFFPEHLREAMHFSLFDRRHPLAHIFPATQHEVQLGLTPDIIITHPLALHNGIEERTILHWMVLCRLPTTLTPVLMCGWQDITESRQLVEKLQNEKEQVKDASQESSASLPCSSHDVRTSVSAILGFLELIFTRQQTAEEDQQCLKLAYATAQSLLGLNVDTLPGNVKAVPRAIRILIAEDLPANRQLLRRQLDTLGYAADEAKDGAEALKLIQQQRYDLLITDLNMPVMDGITLTCRVREYDTRMVIWGLTANLVAGEKERCLASGMNLCLFKPLDLSQLATALCEIKIPQPGSSLDEFLNMKIFAALTLGDKKLMRQMLEQSRVENEKDIAAARAAISGQDWRLAQYHLHRINGTAQILGATAIHATVEQLENALAAGEPEAVLPQGIDELTQQLQALSAAITFFSSQADYH